MPRTATKGLDYTFLDKNFFNDRKVRKLKRKCGDDSPYVFIALLCLIVQEGYYAKYDNDVVDDLADMTGFDEDRIAMILDTCGEVGLLDGHLMEQEHVLTSHGIQKYYADTCSHLKRKAKVEEYSLLGELVECIPSEDSAIPSQNSSFLPQNEEEMQTKEEKRKEKNIKKKKEEFYSSLEEEKEEIIFNFFFRNWAAPSKEYAKIVAFNNTGGRCWETMTRTEKESALTLWKQQPEQPPRFKSDFLSLWETIYTNLRALDAPYAIRMDALSDGINLDIINGRLCLYLSDRLREFIERNLDVFKPIIRNFQVRKGLDSRIGYIIPEDYDHTERIGCAQDPGTPP